EEACVVFAVMPGPILPARGFAYVHIIHWDEKEAMIQVDSDFISVLVGEEAETGIIQRGLDVIDKPLELFYEQIAMRNATGLASVENDTVKKQKWYEIFK